jgi:hypothetical protein
MSEHRPGAGGPANTPPFPRLSTNDISPEGAETGSPNQSASEPLHIADEALTQAEIGEMLNDNAGESEVDVSRTAVLGEGEEEPQPDDLGDLVAGAADQVRRAGRSVNRGFQNVADQLEDLADRLDSVAGLGEARGAARLATVARTSSEYLGDTANYLRTRDVQEMRADLEAQVRTSPLKTLVIALGAGWLVGKIVR